MKRYAITWRDEDQMPVAVLVSAHKTIDEALLLAKSVNKAEFRQMVGAFGTFRIEELPPPRITHEAIERFARSLEKDPLGGFKEVTSPTQPPHGGDKDGQASPPTPEPR